VVHILGDQKSLQVVIYDLDGKELHRSKPLDLQQGPNGRPGAFWIPGDDNRLLFDDAQTMGFYDLKRDKFTMHDNWGSMVSIIDGNPIRPDGKGFLALKKAENGGKEDSLLFVDWEGKAAKIALPDSADMQEQSAYWPTPLRWDGDVAGFRTSDDRIAIDTAKLSAKQDVKTPELSADKKWIHDQFRLSGGAVVRVVELDPAHPKEPPPNDKKPLMRIEVQKPDEKEAKTLFDHAEFAVINPSPDGKMAVVQARNFTKSTGWLFLIDAKGDMAARIDATKAP
ncbi:MAG TPA: hypothetical protein VMS17_21285, partial [Gemmataceae bacterium]|nr:hypothetical protein [Gemmataceae bacterium]